MYLLLGNCSIILLNPFFTESLCIYVIVIVTKSHEYYFQVFDLTRLRGLDANPSRTFNVDKHYARFGNAHNIAANVETETLFVIGATRSGSGYTPCSGKLSQWLIISCMKTTH